MNKTEFDDYLERGWECGANIFYNGKIYFSQCCFDDVKNQFELTTFCFKAEKYGDHSFSPYINKDGKYIEYQSLIKKILTQKTKPKLSFYHRKFLKINHFGK